LFNKGLLLPSVIFEIADFLDLALWGALVLALLVVGATQTGWLQRNILGAVR
jgi:hypothetical protein